MKTEILAVKDEDNERPIPTVWRPVFCDVIKCFVAKDYKISSGIAGVSQLLDETCNQIKDYIQDYGETLVELPDESWETSVCIWMGNHWDVLVDLWTKGEGASDLVLKARVFESGQNFIYRIEMVYVP